MSALKPVDWETRLEKVDPSKHAETILGWLAAAKWPGSTSAPAWEAMFAKLVALNEPATIEPLRGMAKDLPEFLGAKHRSWMAEQIASAADAIAKKSKGKKSSVEPIAVKRPGVSADSLAIVQPVFDAPDDYDLRRVVADRLLEQGDPWGEFIQLGFLVHENEATPEQLRAVELLAKKHSAIFAGPLARITSPGPGREYDRGFLRRVMTNLQMIPRPAMEAAVSSPYWSTVRRAEVAMTDAPKWFTPALLKNPAFGGVREFSFNRYAEPLISLERSSASVPWRVVEVKVLGEGWLRFLRSFIVAEEARVEVGAIEHRDAVEAMIEDVRRKGK